MSDAPPSGGLRRIAIVGAGPSGLATAISLTDPAINPDWRERYEIDIYQMGWRAGGKGATGRNADANDRIEEHGIHLFSNFYFNALRMLSSTVDELEWDEHDKYKTMDEMLLPSHASSATEYVDGRWGHTLTRLMSTPGNPWTGDPGVDPNDVVGSVLEHLARILASSVEARHAAGGSLLERIEELARHFVGDELKAWSERIAKQLAKEREDPAPPGKDRHGDLAADLTDMVDVLADLLERYPDNATIRSSFLELDLIATLFRGLVEDDVAAKGIESIDDENYRDWLARHGASPITLASGKPQALPNTALGYEYGDTTAIPTMSAAAYVMFFTRWVMGNGPGAYFFRQGTGDTIIKPLYRLLVQRGVRFHYFHKLEAVELNADGTRVGRLVFDRQATVRAGTYDPLRRLDDGEQVWPNRPLYDQLVEGTELQKGDEMKGGGYDLESWWTAWKPVEQVTLEDGRDFDHVVLATPISTLEHTCPELITKSDDWKKMVGNVKSAATQAVQLWIDRPTTELGWTGALEGHDRYLGGIFGQDLTSYCDFSDLVDEERWPAETKPKGLIYLIGALSDPDVMPPFDDHDFPRRERARVHWMTVQFLRNIDGLLPDASGSPIDPRSFDFDRLVPHDPEHRGRGVNQFAQQYWRANVDPNERYTLNVKGSGQYRLEAWGSGFDNLVLTGDWIYNGWNVGSFEGAVMSGKLASLALTGVPKLDDVWGYSFFQAPRPAPAPPQIPPVVPAAGMNE